LEENKKTSKNIYPLLKAEGITHKFDYPLFENINLSLYPKQSIAIIGLSGSGKSTLLNIFSSLLKPDSGSVYVGDDDIFSLKYSDVLKLRREVFGIIFQSHYLLRGFNAIDNLNITLMLSDTTLDEDMLKKMKIDHVMKQGIGELSGGQQQRLSIARVLAKQPKIIFADEPTGNLDKDTADDVVDVLFDYIDTNSAGLILVTHEQSLAYKCDVVYKLVDYRLERLK
jgi:putative ABC transport system ATP-binding protein